MIPFYKLSGCGNDFIALVEPAGVPTGDDIRAWCRRGVSLGADGVFALRRLDAGSAPGAVVEMRYWNSDGGAAALCLNGTRCAARLAFHLAWHHGRVTVRTGAGDLDARDLGGDAVAVAAPGPGSARAVAVTTGDGTFEGWLVEVGVPHLVCFCDGPVEEVPLERWAPALRHHRDFGPQGANVDFVRLHGGGELSIRSFERGIEGETLACGTGVLATAAAAVAAGRAELPLRAVTRGGFTLEVIGQSTGPRVDHWELAGDARLVAAGSLFAGAAATATATDGAG